ncbi:MAG: FAD-dependent oxidoreductase [Actinomycetota bacterium]|nr:FAD-dependent oxidoreductase [Actinomycetota bacterium]
MRTNWDVIVVGAGLAGLTAGATAASGGADTVVLEAHQLGGRARTVTKGPYVFNMGAHALYVGGPGTKILRSLGVHPNGSPSPILRYKLLKDGELHDIPFGPDRLAGSTLLGTASKIQFSQVLDLVSTELTAALTGTTVDQWIADHNIRPDVEAIFRALIRLSTFMVDTSEFSADAAIRQLQLGARPGVLYLHGGWTQLIEGLSRQVQVESGCKIMALEPNGKYVVVRTGETVLRARQVIVASGGPISTRALLPEDPCWPGLGRPLTAACLDLGLTRVPSPGYVLSIDEPLVGVVQSPPGRQAPEGQAVVQAIKYGATVAKADRLSLERHVARLGVEADDIGTSRFLARMVVAGSTPRATDGGLSGRPRVTDSGQRGVYIAGDWIGPEGLLVDASIASGHEAAREALRNLERMSVVVA